MAESNEPLGLRTGNAGSEPQEPETIGLDLTKDQAASLTIMLTEQYNQLAKKTPWLKTQIIKTTNAHTKASLQKNLLLCEALMKDAEELLVEVQEIFHELNSKKPKGLIITKP